MPKKQIMVVEDSPIDFRFIEKAINSIDPAIEIIYSRDGQEAVELLEKPDIRPRLILTDLKMPRMNGHEFLQRIKADPGRKMTPVIMFSTSDDVADIEKSYLSHVNAYVVKPDSFTSYSKFATFLKEFWLEHVTLPN